jgi:hypothetical protein
VADVTGPGDLLATIVVLALALIFIDAVWGDRE